MCDCSQKRDDKTVEKVGLETVTLFSKCPAPYRPGRDILEHTVSIGSDRMPIDSIQFTSNATTSDSTKTSLTDVESSSESSRTVNYRLKMFSLR